MTNEEKVQEILDCKNCEKQLCIGGVKCPPTCADYNDLMKMAQWKDEQLKELLKKKMNFFYPPIDDYNEGKLAVLKDLYQELFDEYYI